MGSRLSMAVSDSGRARYHTTPQTEVPQIAASSSSSTHARFLGVTPAVLHSHGFGRDGLDGPACLFPQGNVRFQIAHQLPETGQRERLGAIADGFLGAGMHFQNQSVRAN